MDFLLKLCLVIFLLFDVICLKTPTFKLCRFIIHKIVLNKIQQLLPEPKGVFFLVKGYFIKYNFVLPNDISHSSYTYQKLFRGIYGYTQNVTKSGGKVYKYHRKGVLSDIPFIKAGKNSVIIPQKSFASLDVFFKTGKNPSHVWRVKGEWKATFYMDEKDVDDSLAIKAIKEHISRIFIKDENSFLPNPKSILEKKANNEMVSDETLASVIVESEKIVNSEWFKFLYQKDEELKEFYNSFKNLKSSLEKPVM